MSAKKTTEAAKPRLQAAYEDFRASLQKDLGLKNPMRVPRLKKIVVNIGQGDATQNIKVLEAAAAELAAITGQKPVLTRAKKSIASFKLRKGMPIGCCVTLRRKHMYEFLDRFINVAVPRIRDFRGFSAKAFDGRGGYTVGIKEQIIFPEIDYDKVDRVRGLGITIVTDAQTDMEARALLEKFNFPFRKN
jgi:large subunit ribosomal protein L5